MEGFKFIEETLAEKYPHTNTDEHIWHELANTATQFGPGWHDLIIQLVQKIEQVYKKRNVDVSEFKIDEMKEKYGGLRVSVRSSLSEVHDLITQYEGLSESTCEECSSKSGRLHTKNEYLLTLCAECATEQGYKKVE